MNLATIAIKNTRRNLFRTALTVLGVAVAMLAFLLLRTVLSAWLVGVEYAAKDRLATRHKITFIMQLPKRYVEDVRSVPGVTGVTWFNWFGAKIPGKEDQFFASMATDPQTFFQVYDEVSLPPEQKAKFLANRKGAIIGATLARQFGWKPGDHITMEGTIFPGSWEFDIDGVYTTTRRSIDQSSLYFHWEYLNQSLPEFQREQVGWIASRVPDAGQAANVARKIDALFDPRDIQTLSMSERAMNTSFLGMISTMLDAMQLVSLVILLIMMLVLGNTIAMGVRERTHEYGVLRAIGFLPKHLSAFVVGEATVLGVLGGGLGVAIGIPLINSGVGRYMEENFSGFFPYFRVLERDVAIALALSIVLAVIAAVVPAYQAGKLHVTDALRKFG
ncbi:MAG TPA: FtsX-like permease family protein [Polyangiales bacterium]|nr:FtsX-like permease family protein [Polyangiales bacterium]